MLLFEMLTGNAPFRAKNRGVLQKKILTEKIKYPTFLTSAAHKLLTALLQRDEARLLQRLRSCMPFFSARSRVRRAAAEAPRERALRRCRRAAARVLQTH